MMMDADTIPPSDDPATELATTQRNLTFWFDRAKALELELSDQQNARWLAITLAVIGAGVVGYVLGVAA